MNKTLDISSEDKKSQDDEVLVKVEGVSKKFCRNFKRSLWYGVQDIGAEIWGKKQGDDQLRKDEFWAVKDISFELKRGECLGLIGHNGAGKSTLLKILNGLIKPDQGTVTMKGRIGALIELQAGFNPLLTGRENIYINGQILGYTKKEIDEKFDEIVAFSELEEFIDTPVQNYSSGMKVRLGFAVASQMEPDVLLIDEVLAVGDIGFRMKCLNKIGSLISKTAIIFVSHSTPQVARISNKVLFIERGKNRVYTKEVDVAMSDYLDSFGKIDRITYGDSTVKLRSLSIEGEGIQKIRENIHSIKYGKSVQFIFQLSVDHSVEKYCVDVGLIDKDTKVVASIISKNVGVIYQKTGETTIRLYLSGLLLSAGNYYVSLGINEITEDGRKGKVYFYNSNISEIKMEEVKEGNAPVQFLGRWE